MKDGMSLSQVGMSGDVKVSRFEDGRLAFNDFGHVQKLGGSRVFFRRQINGFVCKVIMIYLFAKAITEPMILQ